MVRHELARPGGRQGARFAIADWLALTVGLGLSGLLGACQPAPPAPTPTAPPPPPTSTIAFPTLVPTGTTTPGPSATPTPDLRSEMGRLLLVEPFHDDTPWRLSQSDSGGSSIAGGRLSISVRRPRAYQLATRLDASYADILVEVDVHTELCSPGDEFGLMLRVNGLGEHYRFIIGCDGTARASRVLEEGSRALTWPIPNPAILPSYPARNRITVLARGDTFRFLVNDVEVLAVRDVSLASGGLGFLARAGSGGQVSVAFDNLTVYALKPDEAPAPTLAASPLP